MMKPRDTGTPLTAVWPWTLAMGVSPGNMRVRNSGQAVTASGRPSPFLPSIIWGMSSLSVSTKVSVTAVLVVASIMLKLTSSELAQAPLIRPRVTLAVRMTAMAPFGTSASLLTPHSGGMKKTLKAKLTSGASMLKALVTSDAALAVVFATVTPGDGVGIGVGVGVAVGPGVGVG